LQDPQRRQRLNSEIDPEIRIFTEMQIKAEYGGAAGDEVTLIPPRKVSTSVPLQQRIAVPERGRQ
jgi:hypothetical protein